jgi:glycogen operon protein
MLLMGDEVRRTQGGNNNAFDQDNEISWINWERMAIQGGLLRFVRLLVHFRQASCLFKNRPGGAGPPLLNGASGTEIHWHGVRLNQPDWGDASHSLAFELMNQACGEHALVLLNAYHEALDFDLPPLGPGLAWSRLVDTSLEAPLDFNDPPQSLDVDQAAYQLEGQAMAVMIAQKIEAR